MSGRSVLIVDDEPLIGRMLKRMFAMRGVHCEIAHGVVPAMAALGRDRFDVVLSDCDMPDGTGFDLADAIKGARRDERVLLMTAACTDEKRDAATSRGVELYDKGDFAGVIAAVVEERDA